MTFSCQTFLQILIFVVGFYFQKKKKEKKTKQKKIIQVNWNVLNHEYLYLFLKHLVHATNNTTDSV